MPSHLFPLLPLAFLEGVDGWIFSFSFITVAVTIWMGFRSAKQSKTASDFFVAGRSVSVGWNASAISGEYLSAASFMGVAGMVVGPDGQTLLVSVPQAPSSAGYGPTGPGGDVLVLDLGTLDLQTGKIDAPVSSCCSEI